MDLSEDIIPKLKSFLEKNMKPSRITHTEGVVETAEVLAQRYGADVRKAVIAAWAHDMARNLPPEELDSYVDGFGLDPELRGRPNLSHSKIGACLLSRDFGISDEDILNAVSYHTTGRADMSVLEKVIFLADVIEPGRNHPGVEKLREIAEDDIDAACLMALENTIEYITDRGEYLNGDTIDARDFLRERRR